MVTKNKSLISSMSISSPICVEKVCLGFLRCLYYSFETSISYFLSLTLLTVFFKCVFVRSVTYSLIGKIF